MKNLPARAIDLAARRELRPVWLVTLTTYTDRGQGTVDTVYRFSDRQILYNYSGAGEVEFFRLLREIDPLAQRMNHLPDIEVNSFDRTLRVQLANLPLDVGGSRLYEVLEGDFLLFATVEVSQILLDETETIATLRGVASGSHVVFFRGEIVSHSADEQFVTLDLRSTLNAIPWVVANDASKNDPADIGKRLPIAYGARKLVPAIGWEVGFATTLAEPITATELGDFDVTDATGFPASGIFTLRIGNENTTAHYVNGTTLNFDSRGVSGTTAVTHGAGEPCIEMPANVRFICNGVAASSLGDAYIQNPSTGELVRVPGSTGLYTRTNADTTLISGKTVASVSWTAANFKTTLDRFFPDVNFDGGVETIENQCKVLVVQASGGQDADGTIGSGATEGVGALDVTGVTGHDDSLLFSMGAAPQGESQIIFRERTIVEYSMESDFARSMTLFLGATSIDTIAANAAAESGHRWASAWANGNGTDTIGDRIGDTLELTITHSTGTPNGDGRWYGLRVYRQFEALTGGNATLAGAIMGSGLHVFVDVNGPTAPDSTHYSVTSGTLLQHPSDIFRHIIAELASYGYDAIDDASFDALVTSLGSGAKIAPILNELGGDLGEVLTALAHECRTNIVQEEGAPPAVAPDPVTRQQAAYAFVNGGSYAVASCICDGSLATSFTFSGSDVVGVHFFDPGFSASSVKIRIYCSGTGSLELRETGGAVIHTFTLPGGSPAWLEWSTATYTSDVDFTLDTVSGVACVLYLFERELTATTTTVTQQGVSATGNTPNDETLVIDGDQGTYCDTGTATGAYVEVEFPDTGQAYYAQRIRIKMESVNAQNFTQAILDNGLSSGLFPANPGITPGAAFLETLEFETEYKGDTYVHFDTTGSNEKIYEVERDLLYLGSPPFPSTGTLFKVYAASTAWAWPASERTLDLWQEISVESRDGSQVFTRFRAFYSPDISKRKASDVWGKALRADPEASGLAGLTTASLINAEKAYGRRDAVSINLSSVYDDATAVDIATYYGREASRDARIFSVRGVPWWLAYDIERGAIVSVTPSWASAASKCRVVEYSKSPGAELVDLRLVEVP